MKPHESDTGEEGPEAVTQTSAKLEGGGPPIPPHNGPPIKTAIGTPDPEDKPARPDRIIWKFGTRQDTAPAEVSKGGAVEKIRRLFKLTA